MTDCGDDKTRCVWYVTNQLLRALLLLTVDHYLRDVHLALLLLLCMHQQS